MTGGGGPTNPPPPSSNDGEFLLRLLQNRHNNPHQQPQQQSHHYNHNSFSQQPPQQQPPQTYNLSIDPAVSAVGPSLPIPNHHQQNPNFYQNPQNALSPPWPHHLSPSRNTSSFHSAPHHHFQQQQQQQQQLPMFGNIPFSHSTSSSNNNMKASNFDQNFDLFKERELGFNLGSNLRNGFDSNRRIDPCTIPNSHVQHNVKDTNFGQNFDLFKERELGINLGGDMRNGFDSNRRIDPRNVPFPQSSSSSNSHVQRNVKDSNFEQNFDLFKEREVGFNLESGMRNGFDSNCRIDQRMNPPDPRRSAPPPGFSVNNSNQRGSNGGLYNNMVRDTSSSRGFSSDGSNYRGFSGSNGKGLENERRFSRQDNEVGFGGGLSGQLDHPGLPAGSAHRSVLGSDVEDPLKVLHGGGEIDNEVSQDEVDELSEQLVSSVLDEEPSDEKIELSDKKKFPRDKDFRSDARGKWILPQRTRNAKKMIDCRRDIHRMGAPFLAIYESLIPPEEEKLKQKQLMTLLEKLVCFEWPNAKLYLYGSCANSFGVSKSDIDVCLAIGDQDINKSEILLKLADILQSDNLENVQALTRARVPIVKLMDPVTGISCDICINNLLAVVNTKLLRDYAEIDGRLRQLAFLVKHWAKSRSVNETYQGTLSSYAYVLMCIHFLQQRNPPILPCLQGMKATYAVTVDHIECAFFDQVEKLQYFGAQNKENIAQLMWGFFSYWAYAHDYANTVVSVRTGEILSKHEKDWTRRVGNDRHLICIEDPFEVSHDLGRVVDKHSIRVLREEFERAAWIMQHDPNPCVSLFQPYVPPAS